MPLYLAVDAGGTKTDFALADETTTLARTRAGSIKRMRVDATTAEANLDAALTELTSASGLSLQHVVRTCVGTAGETVPMVVDWIRGAFGARVAGELVIRGDVEIALDAGFRGGEGILVLAGTGSNVIARGADGKLQGAGGYGPVLADQGSGHRIGQRALRRIFLAKDERVPTLLSEEVLRFWQLGSLNELIAFVHADPRPDISKLAPIVLRCAEAGDALALEVLAHEGEELGYLVRLLLRRSWSDGAHLPSLAFAGSVMEHYVPVRQALLKAVRAEFAGVGELPGVVDPVEGALWRARLAGVTA
ncbi:BadF-type ATPase [Bryocella elongata]|uniref:BadF-type ATPase n=1 Tax=Bryocella elongata TaxID=863522 RepID=A0A1H5XXK7_9BACT|nr:BadF/BadG/BcrA/BcrD ATPase family protein [Bryocella elongata]SEG16265.1 BadF-type ATPase [Bryocella elongata]